MAKSTPTQDHRGRVSGRQKKKSIKANVTSRMGTTRKLSRMGKKVKKGQAGPSTEFVTRSAVLSKLQISLKDFRRLCILKGIYPRVPNKPPKGADKVYYDIKDISYLAHEPLLMKFREFKTFMKKIRKAAGRKQFDEARRKNELKPQIKLDHLVRERYPRFVDALRDMDDALCMVHLFASLPSQGRVTAKHTSTCIELVRHWQYYIARSRNLRKVFVSVKGVYYQSQIMAEDITWLVPHPFTQAFPREVDFRVMITFLEFYEVYLKFVLFKLYHTIGLKYPPIKDDFLNASGSLLMAIKAFPLDTQGSITENLDSHSENKNITLDYESNQNNNGNEQKNKSKAKSDIAIRINSLEDKFATIIAKEEKKLEEDQMKNEVEEESIAIPLIEAFAGDGIGLGGTDNDEVQEDERKIFALSQTDSTTTLFSGLRFFINKEVPLEWMQLCILSFGGGVGWEGPGSKFKVDDPSITHHVIDRPLLNANQTSFGYDRELIQPQWVFDSINFQMLLPTIKYRPGATLPPHLSPFVDDNKEGYVPKYREEITKLKPSTISTDTDNNEDNENDNEKNDVSDYAKEIRAEKDGISYSVRSKINKKEVLDEDNDSDSNDDDDEMEITEQVDEFKTKSSKHGPKAVIYAPKEQNISEEQEDSQLAKIMMTKKTKRLYGRMQHGLEKKKTLRDSLLSKRKSDDDNTGSDVVKDQPVTVSAVKRKRSASTK